MVHGDHGGACTRFLRDRLGDTAHRAVHRDDCDTCVCRERHIQGNQPETEGQQLGNDNAMIAGVTPFSLQFSFIIDFKVMFWFNSLSVSRPPRRLKPQPESGSGVRFPRAVQE